MRFKLILLTSILGAAIGLGLAFLVTHVFGSFLLAVLVANKAYTRVSVVGLTVAPVILTAALSAIFVYRHTANRRKTQSALTAILVLIPAILAMYWLGWLFPPLAVY